MFFSNLDIFGISKDCFEDVDAIVSLAMFFKYDFSFSFWWSSMTNF